MERRNETSIPTEIIPLGTTDKRWRPKCQKYNKNSNEFELVDLTYNPDCGYDIPETHKHDDLDSSEFVSTIHQSSVLSSCRDSTLTNVDEYRCCAPPVGIIVISVIELILFCVDEAEGSTVFATGPIATALIFNPLKRYEVYITYMFVHMGYIHLVANLFGQLLLGIRLEMVHSWWRVLLIYFAGSLETFITDPKDKLTGASGGVYALVTAQSAVVIMIYLPMATVGGSPLLNFIVTGCEVGYAIYNRFILDINGEIGYISHVAGSIVGLLVGIIVLHHIEVTPMKQIVWWISFVIYIVSIMITAIIWNAVY